MANCVISSVGARSYLMHLASQYASLDMTQDVTERRLAEIQIHQQIEHLSALRRIDQAITSNFDLPLTLNTILSEVSKQLQVDAADILLLHTRKIRY